jgi:hypothetical protein
VAPRIYLIVSADDPQVAAAAVARLRPSPDLCIKSPSPRAARTAELALAGRDVSTFDEPLLDAAPGEAPDDRSERSAEALRALYALEASSTLVVADSLEPEDRPLLLDDSALLRLAGAIEHSLPPAI